MTKYLGNIRFEKYQDILTKFYMKLFNCTSFFEQGEFHNCNLISLKINLAAKFGNGEKNEAGDYVISCGTEV